MDRDDEWLAGETELIRRVKVGDHEAWQELYEHYLPPLIKLIEGIIGWGDEIAVNGCAAEALSLGYKSIMNGNYNPDYATGSSFRRYLAKIGENVAKRQLGYRKRGIDSSIHAAPVLRMLLKFSDSSLRGVATNIKAGLYDILSNEDSALQLPADEVLRTIADKLAVEVWRVRQSKNPPKDIRKALRPKFKRILREHEFGQHRSAAGRAPVGELDEMAGGDELGNPVSPRAAGPAETAERNGQASQICCVYAKLEKEQVEVLVLRYMLEYKPAGIAIVFDTTATDVYRRIRCAKHKFETAWHEEYPCDGLPDEFAQDDDRRPRKTIRKQRPNRPKPKKPEAEKQSPDELYCQVFRLIDRSHVLPLVLDWLLQYPRQHIATALKQNVEDTENLIAAARTEFREKWRQEFAEEEDPLNIDS